MVSSSGIARAPGLVTQRQRTTRLVVLALAAATMLAFAQLVTGSEELPGPAAHVQLSPEMPMNIDCVPGYCPVGILILP